MKKLLVTLLAIGAVATFSPASSANAAPYCGIEWGSLPKITSSTGDTGTLTDVRTGQHDCYDRMVVDTTKTGAGYDVRYVTNVYAQGSGALVPLTGGAKLQIVVHSPSYNPSSGTPTYSGVAGQPLPGVNLTGYQTFKSAEFAGSYEGSSAIGLGVRATLPFRVLKLDNRVIVDVAHKW